MKILVGITGASYASLGFKLLKFLSTSDNEIYAIVSKNAQIVLKEENGLNLEDFKFKNVEFFSDFDISKGPSSGSFGIDKMIISPCSVNSLAKISNGIADTLITRSAAVILKERKDLILAVREMPISTISLRQMADLSSLGVVIAPPIIASYAGIKSVEMIENFIIGKWLDLLKIKHNLYNRWS